MLVKTSLSTSGQQRFCFRTITCTARITVGMRAITCTARITAGMRAITRTRTSGVRTITCNASAGSMKYRQHTLENAGKLEKQRMVSEKTGFGKVEITRPYVGKRRQVSKATYGSEINISNKWKFHHDIKGISSVVYIKSPIGLQ